MLRVTAYIPCFNGDRYLEPTLCAVLGQTRSPDQILVIDDGSTDQTVAIAGRQGVRVISHVHNRGIAAARNTAWRESDGDILLGLDVDAIPDPDFVERITAVFEAEPNLAAVCGRLIEANCERPPDHWRQVHMAQHYGHKVVENPRICFGAVTALRRSAIKAVGGWNERYRTTHEDVDMTDRLGRAELTARYEPGCIARHQRTDTVASVLSGFWNWFAPRGREKGHFQSWDRLIDDRIEGVTWGIFRHRFAQDLEHDRTDLLAITLLLPWWMTLHDLAELADPDATPNRTATVRERASTAAALIGSIGTVVGATGASPYVIDRMTRFLQAQLRQLFPSNSPAAICNPQPAIRNLPGDTPKDEFIARLNNAAADALPSDPKIWAGIDSSMRLVEL